MVNETVVGDGQQISRYCVEPENMLVKVASGTRYPPKMMGRVDPVRQSSRKAGGLAVLLKPVNKVVLRTRGSPLGKHKDCNPSSVKQFKTQRARVGMEWWVLGRDLGPCLCYWRSLGLDRLRSCEISVVLSYQHSNNEGAAKIRA